ncbi:MAG TPA: asparagine synthase-related protein [Candidatus Elarobacter sp.]|jgi:hypothetical protein|nr:asparagine synthase-related protein [Candidatus Elarobacter sp.]
MTNFSVYTGVRLRPAHGWHQLAGDDGARVWLTTASYNDIARFEPGIRIPDSTRSDEIAEILRRTDHAAFVIVDHQKRFVAIECRPRAGDRLYVHRDEQTIEVSAGIEYLSDLAPRRSLSNDFVAFWLANALIGALDHYFGTSPFDGVHLIARGIRAELPMDGHAAAISFTLEAGERFDCSTVSSVDDAIRRCWSAIRNAIANATKDSAVLAECSGGIDSGLVAVLASRECGHRFRAGVFADYPYYEFRQERSYAKSIADRAGFELLPADPLLSSQWGVWARARSSSLPREPSLDIPFFGQVLAAYDQVTDREPCVVLSGQGGDMLFQMTEGVSPRFNRPRWTEPELWDRISEATDEIRRWSGSSNHARSGYNFDNPWMSRALDRLHPGAIYYSPLSARAVVDSVLQLREILEPMWLEGSYAPSVQKPLAYAAFAELLPKPVWERRWKVNFVGLHYRYWLTSGQDCIELVTRMQPFLEKVGIRPKALIKAVTEAAEGRNCSDRLINAIVTYAFWLERFLFCPE